ncbi:MAG: outer membrane beta-barrel protein [Persicimonas sp.]
MTFGKYRWLGAIIVLVGGLLSSLPASGQPGDNVRSSGGWVLSPSITLSGSYNTNVFRTSSQEFEPVVDSTAATLKPRLSVDSPKERVFLLSFVGDAAWQQYLGQLRGVEQSIDVGEQSGLSTNLNLSGHLNPDGNFSLQLDELFNRQNVPSPTPGADPYNWYTNTLGATAGIHPGGRVLRVDLGYDWRTYGYESDALEGLDRQEHHFNFNGQWSFLPKTQLFVDATYGLVRWEQRERFGIAGSADQVLINSESTPLRVQGGLSGRVTRRIGIRAQAGYGWSFHEEGPSFDGVLGQFGLAFAYGRLASKNSLELGYRKDFGISTVGNFFALHEVFTTVEQGLWDRMMTLYLSGRFQVRDYSTDAGQATELDDLGGSLNDELLAGRAGIRADLGKWLSADLRYGIRANFTDDRVDVPAVDPDDPSLAVLREYTQHLITLSTTFKY